MCVKVLNIRQVGVQIGSVLANNTVLSSRSAGVALSRIVDTSRTSYFVFVRGL